MSAFLAFRTAVVSVLRPRNVHRITQDLVTINTTSPMFQTAIRGTKRSHPKNGQIPYEVVQVLDPDGTMHHPTRLTKLLESIDPTTHLVRLIEHHPPTVQILTQLEEKMRKLQTKAEKKVSESKRRIANKEAQLSWFTSGMDLEHKLAKAKAELQKGDVRLDVVFNPKRGVRNPTRDEMLRYMQEVVDALADVGNEWREREFRGGSVRLFLQSTVRKNTKALPTQDEIQELAREERKRVERQVQKLKRKHGDQDITVSRSLLYEIKIQISMPSRSSYTVRIPQPTVF